MNMRKDGLQRVLDFLDFLREKGIEFRLDQQAPDELMVTFALVGARVEATFDVNMMHFCVFKGSEAVETDEKALQALIKEHWDD
jgi:hypothetical protein